MLIPYNVGIYESLIERAAHVKHNLYRLNGRFSFEDQIKLACYTDVPMFFLKHGVMIVHAYGITLSPDRIGADCWIGQNTTIGTGGKDMNVGEHTTGHRPSLGNLVMVWPGSVISGAVHIGDMVIIAAQSFVDKDVPDRSIVYGRNDVRPLSEHHYTRLMDVLYHCMYIRNIFPGLVYRDGKLFTDTDWLEKRKILFNNRSKLNKTYD